MDGGSGAGVTINPVAFLVIQENSVKLMPVNHSSSFDKLLDYIPDLMERVSNMMNKCLQEKNNTTQTIIKQMQKKQDENMKKQQKDKMELKEKIEKEARRNRKDLKKEINDSKEEDSDIQYEFEYDETLEDE